MVAPKFPRRPTHMTDTIITLTTIPPRLSEIGDTISSLRAQTARIDAIQLWIPRTYRRKEFQDFSIPTMPAGVDVMRCDFDYGPATKVLPAVRKYAGQDVNIIYCDDDEYYDPGFAQLLLDTSRQRPGECIAICGQNISTVEYDAHINGPAFKILSVLTLEMYRKIYKRKYWEDRPGIGPVDIAHGFGGVLVRPEFFGESVYDIPDVLWTVDDIWLSGQMQKQGISIYRAAERKMCRKTASASVADLTNLSYQGYNRQKADLACVKYFRKNHAIWVR